MGICSTRERLERKFDRNLELSFYTDYMIRFAEPTHGSEGAALIDLVWEETLAEFDKFGARDIIEAMEK